MAAATIAVVNPIAARANTTADAGSVAVSGLSLSLLMLCPSQAFPCSIPITATSSGSLSGLDGTTPYSVAWADPPVGSTNVSGTLTYTSSCLLSAWEGASVLASSFITISGATMVYGGTAYTVSVTLWFGGSIDDGLFVPMTWEAAVSGGPTTLDIGFLGVPGAMVNTPTNVPTNCNTDTATFTSSGVFLTAA